MEVKLTGKFDIKPTQIEFLLEERLKKHGLAFPYHKYNDDLSFGKNIIDLYLIDRSTSDDYPRLSYSRKLHGDCFTLNQFVCKLNDYRHQTEYIDITFSLHDNETIHTILYGGKDLMFLTDDWEKFTVEFLQSAYSNFYKTHDKLPSNYQFYDRGEIIKWIEREKRAHSPPSALESELKPDALNRELVYMLVDEFARRLQQK